MNIRQQNKYWSRATNTVLGTTLKNTTGVRITSIGNTTGASNTYLGTNNISITGTAPTSIGKYNCSIDPILLMILQILDSMVHLQEVL